MTPQGPELRIGDAEREAAVAALGEHYAAGRLTKEEYDERSAHAYAARTRSALWPLFADLPRVEPERPVAAPATDTRPRRSGWVLGVPFVPLLLIAFVVSILVGRPVILFVLLAFLVVRTIRSWGAGPRHHQHHHHGRGGWR